MAQHSDRIWQSAEVVQRFLRGTRGALPLATYQIEILLRLVKANNPTLNTFLDLGCGDGILGRYLLAKYPTAEGVFLDFSEPMLTAARQALAEKSNIHFVSQDYGEPGWTESLKQWQPFDVIVSGFSIHHQPDARKREIYQELYDLLRPGGIFLNLEHVSSPTAWLTHLSEELMIDGLYAYEQEQHSALSREAIAANFYNRSDQSANILASVEEQNQWLRDIGFAQVDCYVKVFEFALFGGVRPA
ncbi:MAG TPA: class I SAM-dependent methyltransferase [Phototrophicaceae bacterium]|nr:class I SAM-dependent methyltransferase [Phototrophicaceae bacterium]